MDQIGKPKQFLKEHNLEEGQNYFITKDGLKLILQVGDSASDEIVVYNENGEWAASISKMNGSVSLHKKN